MSLAAPYPPFFTAFLQRIDFLVCLLFLAFPNFIVTVPGMRLTGIVTVLRSTPLTTAHGLRDMVAIRLLAVSGRVVQ